MTRTIILSTIVAATLMTGLLVGSFPTTSALHSISCPPDTGTFVTIVGIDGVSMTYPIDGYTYSTASDRKNPAMFMFTFEPDDDEGSEGIGLSAKILAAIKSGDIVEVHFTACKEIIGPDGEVQFKEHEVWLKGSMITETSETTGDDGFPTEKVTGTFTEITKMTSTSPSGTE